MTIHSFNHCGPRQSASLTRLAASLVQSHTMPRPEDIAVIGCDYVGLLNKGWNC